MQHRALALILATGCTDAPHLAFTTAAQSETGCTPQPTRGLPAEVDRVVVQVRDVVGEWKTVGELPRDGGNGAVVERITAGPTDLRLVACEGPVGTHEARPAIEDVPDGQKRTLVAHFRRNDHLTCAGTGFGPTYDSFARLARPMAFGAAARLPGREELVVVGGAGQVLEDRLQTRDDGQEWQIFAWREGLFWPGLERATPITRRALDEGRAGLEALPLRAGTGEGLLLAGGAPNLQLVPPPAQGTWLTGPILPADNTYSEPGLAFLDGTTGAAAPILAEDGRPVPLRILAGIGQGLDGRIVRAGGLEYTLEGPRASAAVEVINGGRLTRHTLPAALLGPTITHLGDDTYLVWGADVPRCGATPGYLITLDPLFAATPLQLANPPACADVCRDWYATAYHTATPLTDGPAGEKRVLILGGLVVRDADLAHNPDPGADCPANAFVLAINPVDTAATVHPVAVPEAARHAARRALHRAVPVRDRVLITGGWGSFGIPTSFVAGDDVLFYDDATPAGTLRLAAPMARRRFGHVAAALPEDRVLLVGGLAPAQVDLDPATGNARFVDALQANDVAEIYTPPLQADPCPLAAADAGAEPDAEAAGDAGGEE